jgi:hypothetical protein
VQPLRRLDEEAGKDVFLDASQDAIEKCAKPGGSVPPPPHRSRARQSSESMSFSLNTVVGGSPEPSYE